MWYYIQFNKPENVCKFLNKHKLTYDKFKYSDSGVGWWPYSILYYSETGQLY